MPRLCLTRLHSTPTLTASTGTTHARNTLTVTKYSYGGSSSSTRGLVRRGKAKPPRLCCGRGWGKGRGGGMKRHHPRVMRSPEATCRASPGHPGLIQSPILVLGQSPDTAIASQAGLSWTVAWHTALEVAALVVVGAVAALTRHSRSCCATRGTPRPVTLSRSSC